MGTFTVGLGCNANLTASCGVYINVTIKNDADTMVVMMEIASGKGHNPTPASFPLFPEESELQLRIMTDTRSVEVFLGEGRAVYSGGLSTNSCIHCKCRVLASSTATGATVSATGWHMASIFSDA